jgi:hypothetical protein
MTSSSTLTTAGQRVVNLLADLQAISTLTSAASAQRAGAVSMVALATLIVEATVIRALEDLTVSARIHPNFTWAAMRDNDGQADLLPNRTSSLLRDTGVLA